MQSAGYWEPHTSSVDFCEPNYLLTSYVAELHNTWSSLWLVLLGIVGSLFCNVSREWRNIAMFSVLSVVGVGSVALHGTLHWFWQSSDEVPMLWMNLAFLFSLLNMVTNWGNSTRISAILFIAIGVLQTYVYYMHRHLYWLFLLQYISGVVLIVAWSSNLVFSIRTEKDFPIRWWLFSRAMCSYVFIAAILWIYEMNHCDILLPYYHQYYGLSFHNLWHIGAGLGTYLECLLLSTCRAQSLGITVELKWISVMNIPIIPIITRKK